MSPKPVQAGLPTGAQAGVPTGVQAGVQAGVLARGTKNRAVRVLYWDTESLSIIRRSNTEALQYI